MVSAYVVSAITNRLDEIESIIKPLEKEYRELVEHLEVKKVCIQCGKEGTKKEFSGQICRNCYRRAWYAEVKSFRTEKKEEEVKKKEKIPKYTGKSLDMLNGEAGEKNISYGKYIAMIETMKNKERL